jgi:hypothetical protein
MISLLCRVEEIALESILGSGGLINFYPSLGSSFSHNKMADERTFIAIKPDGVQRGLVCINLVLLMQPRGSARERL